MANFSPKEVEIFKAIQELSERLAEDRLYEVVAEEIDRKDYDPVSKLKALEEAKGDEQLAKSIYAKHRVRRLRDLSAEYELIQAAAKMEAERKKKKKAEEEYFKGAREREWLKNIDTEAIRKRTKR